MTREPDRLLHPDPETLAAFADGRPCRWSRADLVEHLDRCEDCMSDVALAMKAHAEELPAAVPARRWGVWAGAVAAAIVLALLALPATRELIARRLRPDPMARLVALAPRAARAVEPRLTGGFAWAAYQGAARAGGTTHDAQQLKLAGAAGELVERANADDAIATQHAAGVALLLVHDPIAAIGRLEPAARRGNSAAAWSDLAAARLAAADDLDRASLYPEALAAADEALRIDTNHAEALFNRALILERLGLIDEARRAWMRYLEIDPGSPWANEARAHLRELPEATRSSRFDRDRPLFERTTDAAAVRRLVDAHRERFRAYAETETLGAWAEAILRGDQAGAARQLAIARRIGDALVPSGEALLQDAVDAIDAAPAKRAIAEAHAAYRRGRIAYSRHALADARRELLRSADAFASARSPMALMARVYAAGVDLADQDVDGARAMLERALADAGRHPRYLAHAARVRWELGRVRMLDDDPSGAAPILAEGAELFRKSGDAAGEAFVEGMLADALDLLGRADDAWAARIRAFAVLGAEGESVLLSTAIAAAVRSELRDARRETALALAQLRRAEGRRPVDAVNTLVGRALLASSAGKASEALAAVEEARGIAGGVSDGPYRARLVAGIDVAAGAAAADPRAAVDTLTRAIDFYRAHELSPVLAEPLLLRARSALRLGDRDTAAHDLGEGMTLVERHPSSTGMLDAEHALFDEAILMALDRGDVAGAVALTERSRGATLTVAELQQRLAGSGAAVVVIAMLSNEVVTFAVTERELTIRRRPATPQKLAALAAESLSENGTTAAAALYDVLFRGVDLPRASLIVVPDRRLAEVPFAALYDVETRRRLIERVPLAIATSAASLSHDRTAGEMRTLLPVALSMRGLASADRELREVAAFYASPATAGDHRLASIRTSDAEVVHLAGHTGSQPGGGEHALLFAGDERATWKSIVAAAPIRARVVVLAACETLRSPASARTRAPSLAAAFVSAGAADVVGTLAPIGDRDARTLFRAFHRELAAGASAMSALRAAQLEAIAEERNGGSRGWRAVALLTRRIPAPHQKSEVSSWAR